MSNCSLWAMWALWKQIRIKDNKKVFCSSEKISYSSTHSKSQENEDYVELEYIFGGGLCHGKLALRYFYFGVSVRSPKGEVCVSERASLKEVSLCLGSPYSLKVV